MNEVETLAARRLALLAIREDADEGIRQIDAQLVAALSVGDPVKVDGETLFRVQQKNTFSLDKARAMLPETVIEAATVPTVDVKLLKSLMPPAAVKACMVPGATFVGKVKS